MGTQAVLNDSSEGKPTSYTNLTWDQSIVDVFDRASEPLQAFIQIMEDVPGDFVPDEGHPRLCAKVLEVLLDHQRRVMAQAVECVDGQVGKIILNAHLYGQENREARIAGQYCRARIIE
jgi:hypothetical protein